MQPQHQQKTYFVSKQDITQASKHKMMKTFYSVLNDCMTSNKDNIILHGHRWSLWIETTLQ